MDGIAAESGNTALPAKVERDQFGRVLPGSKLGLGHGRPLSESSVIAQLHKRLTPAVASKIARQILDRAKEGQPFYVELLLNRLYGRVPQVTRVAGLQDEDGTEQPIPLLLLPPMLADAIDVEATTVNPPSQEQLPPTE